VFAPQGPVLAAYVTANSVVPLPFKEQIEQALQRPAICM
jgi:hypothetical protein